MNDIETMQGLSENELLGFNLTMARETVSGAIATNELSDEILNDYIECVDKMYFSEGTHHSIISSENASNMVMMQVKCIFEDFDFELGDINKQIIEYIENNNEITVREAVKYTIHDLIGLYIA